MDLGDRIRERRKELGISQEELARRMGLKSKSTICKVETGDDNLTAETIKRYAKALNTTSSTLLGLTGASDYEGKLVAAYVQATEDAELLNIYHKLNESSRKMLVETAKVWLSVQPTE